MPSCASQNSWADRRGTALPMVSTSPTIGGANRFGTVDGPMTTGAGTISVILTLSAHEEDRDLLTHLYNLSALVIAVLMICVLVYICYVNTARIIHRLGPRGEQIVNRLSAFIVFCIGMQIGWSGIRALLKS